MPKVAEQKMGLYRSMQGFVFHTVQSARANGIADAHPLYFMHRESHRMSLAPGLMRMPSTNGGISGWRTGTDADAAPVQQAPVPDP